MRILIPSYHRADRMKTVHYLCGICGISATDITISLQDDADIESYKKFGCDLHYAPATNVAGNRNNGLRYLRAKYPGEDIVMFDDDIDYLLLLTKEGDRKHAITRKLKGEELITILSSLFEYASKKEASLWGINALDNPLFMKTKVLQNIILAGCVMGFVGGGKELYFDEEFALKEDYELSLRAMQQGERILKFCMLAPRTNFRAPGGCTEVRKKQSESKFANRLLEEYAGIIKADPQRPGEIKMI